MTEFKIKVASRVVTIRAMFDSSREYCASYLSDEAADFQVEITSADLALEREKSAQTDRAKGIAVRNLSDAQLEITAIQRKVAQQLFQYDTVLFHGSVVAVDGEAFLFTAKSGTGKSTHTRLWRQVFGEHAVMVNDDKPFLRVTEGGILACGSPWNGKHRMGSNICMPLKAICILERGEENTITKIPGSEAVFMLLQQSNRPSGAAMMAKYMELIDEISQKVAFYRLGCNMEPEAAKVSYQAMSGHA